MNQALPKRTVADIPIFECGEVASTQEIARDLLSNSPSALHARRENVALSSLLGVVSATNQTHGRGRRDRTWESVENSSMLATFIIKNRASGPMVDVAHLMVTICDLINVNGPTMRIKWPNDLVIETDLVKKVGGCLTEIIDDVLLVGVGINITSDAYPRALIEEATSLEENGYNILPEELVSRIVEEFSRRVADDSSDLEIWDQYKSSCATLSQLIRVEGIKETYVGKARDINPDGSLIVETEAGKSIVVTEGDVVHIRAGEN